MSEPLPDWMVPPREEGWFADDLDALIDAPRHTELWDGALIFRMAAQRGWPMEVIDTLKVALKQQAPVGTTILRELTIRLDERNRLEPDIIAISTPYDQKASWYAAGDVTLVIEVTSPESAHRDRTAKLRKYAEAGIPHYWIVDQESDEPVVHVYELDKTTSAYVATDIARDRLRTPVPFPIEIDLTSLA